MPVAGGGGEAAMTALRARVTAGNPPTAVQMLGFDILDWAERRRARRPRPRSPTAEGWDKVVPTALQNFSKYDGKWVAAPVNVHSTNWVWINKAVLDAAGGNAPTTWDELVAVLDTMKANGITPLAHGGQAWQDATIFDGVVLWLGTDFYKAAFIDLDPAALGGEQMTEAFDHLIKLRGLCRRQLLGPRLEPRLGHGDQRQGRHADHGRLGQGRVPEGRQGAGHRLRLHPLPRHAGLGHLQLRPVRHVQRRATRRKAAQAAMASGDHGPGASSRPSTWSRARSRPAPTCRTTPSTTAARRAWPTSPKPTPTGTLFGSMAHGHAAPASVKNATYDVITAAFNGEYADGAAAAAALADAVAAAQ